MPGRPYVRAAGRLVTIRTPGATTRPAESLCPYERDEARRTGDSRGSAADGGVPDNVRHADLRPARTGMGARGAHRPRPAGPGGASPRGRAGPVRARLTVFAPAGRSVPCSTARSRMPLPDFRRAAEIVWECVRIPWCLCEPMCRRPPHSREFATTHAVNGATPVPSMARSGSSGPMNSNESSDPESWPPLCSRPPVIRSPLSMARGT